MANISHFTQTVNGVSTTYDIHDANAVPRSGGAVMTGNTISRAINNDELRLDGGTGWGQGASVVVTGKDSENYAGYIRLVAQNGSTAHTMTLAPDGTLTWDSKNVAMQEDVIPRSGGAVMMGNSLGRTVDNDQLSINGGSGWDNGATIRLFGGNSQPYIGEVQLHPQSGSNDHFMQLKPDGTWAWDGSAIQYVSDQRLKQQISEIDDKLLDAWGDVNLVQFKYNDAVDQKGKDEARLHTGYVVQQIDKACKSHCVDISAYGLYCHEEYPEETEEVEVEQKDGTKAKERKVIREANEHYSLRYTEVYAVECMYLRRCIARLTARIEELEKEREASK